MITFALGFIDFMLKAKSLLVFTNQFSPNDYKSNNKIIYIFFSIEFK